MNNQLALALLTVVSCSVSFAERHVQHTKIAADHCTICLHSGKAAVSELITALQEEIAAERISTQEAIAHLRETIKVRAKALTKKEIQEIEKAIKELEHIHAQTVHKVTEETHKAKNVVLAQLEATYDKCVDYINSGKATVREVVAHLKQRIQDKRKSLKRHEVEAIESTIKSLQDLEARALAKNAELSKDTTYEKCMQYVRSGKATVDEAMAELKIRLAHAEHTLRNDEIIAIESTIKALEKMKQKVA